MPSLVAPRRIRTTTTAGTIVAIVIGILIFIVLAIWFVLAVKRHSKKGIEHQTTDTQKRIREGGPIPLEEFERLANTGKDGKVERTI